MAEMTKVDRDMLAAVADLHKVPEGAWLTPSSEIKWVKRDVPYLTENKPAILDKWNALWAEIVK